LRITPYRTLDNRIEGVVLTILNKSADTQDDANNGGIMSTSAGATSKTSVKKTRKKSNHTQ
jgi:hypothetical protein